MKDKLSFRAIISGRVQGVFFRGFVELHARRLGVEGYVRNQQDGAVEVVAEGDRNGLEELASLLKQGPSAARVDNVQLDWGEVTGAYHGFSVR